VIVLILAACGSDATPTQAPRNPATLTAPTGEAWTTGDVPITLENVQTIRYLGRLDPPDVVATWFDFTLSPDSTALAALNVDQLASWDLLTGRPFFYTGRGNLIHVYYSPDKTELYGVTDAGVTDVYDALTGSQMNTFNAHPAFAAVTVFHADTGWLALGGTDGTIKVWDTFERQSLVTINAHSEAISVLAFSEDGTRLASASIDGIVRVWDWQSRQQIDQFEPENADILHMTFSPDGTRLALGTGTTALLWTFGLTPTTMDTGGSEVLLFNGDGRYLLAGSRSDGLTLWDGVQASYIGLLPDTAGDGVTAAFSPDGSLLITATLNRGVFLWNLNEITGEQLNQATLEIGTRQIYRVHWTDDGRLILFFDAVGAIYLWGIAQGS